MPPEKILASAERPLSQFLAVTQTLATGARGIFGAGDILAKHSLEVSPRYILGNLLL